MNIILPDFIYIPEMSNKFNDCGNAINLGPNGNGVENLKFENNWIQSCNGVTVGMGGNKKLVRAAISLHSQSKQYVKLRIAANKVYSSKVGLDNNVKGLNIQKSNAVTLKKGLLTTKNSDR